MAKAIKFTLMIISEMGTSRKEIEQDLSDLNYIAEIIGEELIDV